MDAYLTIEEVAERYRTTEGTVRFWRHKGYGPKGVKLGTRVLYPVAEIERFDRELAEEAGAVPASKVHISVPLTVPGASPNYTSPEFLKYIQGVTQEVTERHLGMKPKPSFEYGRMLAEEPFSVDRIQLFELPDGMPEHDPRSPTTTIHDVVSWWRDNGWKVFRRRVVIVSKWEELNREDAGDV